MLQVYVRPLTYFKSLQVCLFLPLMGIKGVSVILLFLKKILAEYEKKTLKIYFFSKC